MGAILSYSLSVSVIVLLLYPVLHQIVNRSTSFGFNRAVLIGAMALSLILPWVSNTGLMPVLADESMADANFSLAVAPLSPDTLTVETSTQDASSSFPWIAIAVIIYFSGVAILIGREVISFVRLFRMIARCDKTHRGDMTICRLTDKATAPFSWGKYIFLREDEYDSTVDSIFIHEKAHTEKRHWIDVLFADMFCILLWYNPFAWMTRQLMKLNHEFEADSAVIGSGVDTYDYQRLLVVKAMGGRAIPVTNSFAADKRSFRKRVLIMSKKRSSKNIRLIALCAIPSAVFAVIAISLPVSADILDNISDYKFERPDVSDDKEKLITDISEDIISEPVVPAIDDTEETEELPSPLTDQTALSEIIKLSLAEVKADNDTKVNIELVVGEDGRVKEVLTNASEGSLLAEAITRKLNGVKFEQMTENGRPVEVRFNIPVTIQKNRNDNTVSNEAKNAEATIFPEFIGGNSALSVFIIENVKTPDLDTQPKERKTVNVHFTVDVDGSVKDTKVPASQGQEFDDEAIRVINLTSGMWKPAVQNGDPVAYTLSIPITFSNL